MVVKTLYASITNTSNIEQVRFSEAHNDSAPMVTIDAINTSLTIGDSISVDLGYVTDHEVILNGYVKDITRTTPPTKYSITAYGTMIRAVDYFLASSDPNSPFTRENISAEDLVGDLLAEAGLTNYGYDATSFVFAVTGPLEVNLTAIYDYCNSIANTLAWHLYADNNGKCWFVERLPEVMPGDVSVATLNTGVGGEIINVSYSQSDRDLRNRVVVYGRNGISAEASAVSPHLPTDFYKSVVASADWIDTQSMAQGAADRNLDLLNKLTEEATVTIIGDPNLNARDVVTVVDTYTGLNDDFYVYGIDHYWSTNGYTTTLSLRK